MMLLRKFFFNSLSYSLWYLRATVREISWYTLIYDMEQSEDFVLGADSAAAEHVAAV